MDMNTGIWIRNTEEGKTTASWKGALHYIDEAKGRLAIMQRQDWFPNLGDNFPQWIDGLTSNTTPLGVGMDIIHVGVFEHEPFRLTIRVVHNIDRKEWKWADSE
tara:strand:- start:342 stop:653 length:312 start_codon:yes stop_codon:yes gene_type:complete